MCQSAHAVGEILKDRSKSSGFPVDCQYTDSMTGNANYLLHFFFFR